MPTWPSRVVGESHFLPPAGTKLCDLGAFADTRTHYPTITLIKRSSLVFWRRRRHRCMLREIGCCHHMINLVGCSNKRGHASVASLPAWERCQPDLCDLASGLLLHSVHFVPYIVHTCAIYTLPYTHTALWAHHQFPRHNHLCLCQAITSCTSWTHISSGINPNQGLHEYLCLDNAAMLHLLINVDEAPYSLIFSCKVWNVDQSISQLELFWIWLTDQNSDFPP